MVLSLHLKCLERGDGGYCILLGICDIVAHTTHKKLFVFYARKAILFKWKQPDPLTVSQWKFMIDLALPLYKLIWVESAPKSLIKFGLTGLRLDLQHFR